MQHSIKFQPELRSLDHDAEDLTSSLSFFYGVYLALIFFCSSAREMGDISSLTSLLPLVF